MNSSLGRRSLINSSEELQRELLGPTRFAALERGEIQINSFANFERATLNTLEDLGL